MVPAGCKCSAWINPSIYGKVEGKSSWVIFPEEPLIEMLSVREGLGLLGWVRFGFLVVW